MSLPIEPQRELLLRFLAEPKDVNFGGRVHGGAVMRWMDQAGYACASGYCGGYAVTVAVSEIEFKQPINIGDVVEVLARVVHTGRTSMHIEVEVFHRTPTERQSNHATHCMMVFVAVDQARQPVAVPALSINSDDQLARQQYAIQVHTARTQLAAATPRPQPHST
jgi:uncharacterized protein (TIGR00369 family)